MPLKIELTVICDGCGSVIMPAKVVKHAEIDRVRWNAQRAAVAIHTPRRATKFYCPQCADGPAKP